MELTKPITIPFSKEQTLKAAAEVITKHLEDIICCTTEATAAAYFSANYNFVLDIINK